MRTKTEDVKRYFRAIWAVHALIMVAVAVGLSRLPEPVPDWGVVAFAVMAGFASGVVGFLHGITLVAAREQDLEAESKQSFIITEGEEVL